MAGQFSRLLTDLLENHSGHQTNSPIENGGWIYQDKKGKLSFLRAEKYGGGSRRKSGSIDLRNAPPTIKGARVVGRAHTHPYNVGTQAGIRAGDLYGGPSSRATNGVDADLELSARDQMPSIVVYQSGVINGRREITIEIANPSVHVMPDKNCRRVE